MKRALFILLTLGLILTACSTGSPETAVETYINAMVDGDVDAAINTSCTAWEAGAGTDVNGFGGVEASLENLSCSVISQADGNAVISCDGQIVASYNGEDRAIELNARNYLAVEEGGEWLMCGYE